MVIKPIKVLIELRPSKIQGVGVFAVSDIKKGQKIADGLSMGDFKYLISWKEYKKYNREVRKKIDDFCIGTPKGFIPPDDLDFNKLSIEWYLSHSCDGNVGFNGEGDFIAVKNIKAGSELGYDYGLAESNPAFKMRCKCQSKKCRKTITGDDWKKLRDDTEKFRYMHPFLKT